MDTYPLPASWLRMLFVQSRGLWVALIFLAIFSAIARADYVVDRYNGTLSNTGTSPQRYRVTMYEAVERGGEAYGTYPGHSNNIPGMGYSGAGSIIVGWREYLGPSGGGSSLGDFTIGTFDTTSVGGSVIAFPFPAVDRVNPTSQSMRYIWRRNDPYYQATWNTTGQNTNPWEIAYTDETITRGGIIHHWEFEVGAASSTTLNLEHDGPFFVVIEKLKQYQTPDGGSAYQWEEESEETSTEVSEVSEDDEPPEWNPATAIPAPDVEVTSFDDLPAAERPETVDSFSTLDEAQEARHSDEKGLLAQIRNAIGAVKDAIAGLNAPGKGEYDVSDTEEEEEAESEMQGKISDLWGKLDDIRGNFNSLGAATNMDIPSGGPQFTMEITLKGETYSWESPVVMDNFFAIVRALTSALISFYAVVGGINIARGAFADQPS